MRFRRVTQLAVRYPTTIEAAWGMGRVARTGQAEMVSDVSDGVLTESARDPEHLTLLRGLGLKSFIIVPIRGRGRVHAILRLATPSRAGATDRRTWSWRRTSPNVPPSPSTTRASIMRCGGEATIVGSAAEA